MMERSKLSLAAGVAVLSAGLLVMGVAGCEKETSPPPPSGTSAPAATQAAGEAAAGVADSAQTAGESAADSAADAAGKVSDAADAAKADAAGAADAGAAAAGDAQAKATELLGQVTQYVKENKLDLADKALKQLDALKPQLPESYHGKIDGARSMVETAKKGQGLKDLLPK